MVARPKLQTPPSRVFAPLVGLIVMVLAGCNGSASEDAAAASIAPPTSAPTTSPAPPPAVTSGTIPAQVSLEAALDQWLLDSGSVGAVAAAVLPDGRVISSAVGWSDRELEADLEVGANFRIGSITKVYTAALIMQLAEDGLLAVGDPVQQYVPAAPAAMSVGQLLSHTSGLRDVDVAAGIFAAIQDPESVATPADTLGSALREPLAFDPGRRQSYSSIGYLVLERIIEAATGQSFEDALDKRILSPLGLDSTALERSDSQLPTPYERLSPGGPQISLATVSTTGLARAAGAAGALVAPAEEVAAFAAALFGGRVVAPASLMTMMDTSGDTLVEFGQGLAVYQVGGDRRFGHNGRTIGFASSLRHSPAAAITVVVLSNDGSAPTDELADSLVSLLADVSDS